MPKAVGSVTGGCRQKKLRDQIEVVRCDVVAPNGVDPAKRLSAIAYEPEIHVKCDITRDRRIDVADLIERDGSAPSDVLFRPKGYA